VTPSNGESKQLPRKANELLVQLWHQIQTDERQLTQVRLRRIAQQVSLDACEAGLRSEELIIAVKESWRAREGITHVPDPQRSQVILADFISLCITEYYPKGDDTVPSRASDDRRRGSAIRPEKRKR